MTWATIGGDVAGQSTTTLSTSPNPSVAGQPVTLTATVSAKPPATGTPTGTVTFTAAGQPGLSATLDATGTARASTAALSTGRHMFTAHYHGDATFNGSNSTSHSQTVNVLRATLTATVAAVSPGSGTPTGTVTFVVSGGPTLTAALDATGTATVSTGELSAGSHTCTVQYHGDQAFGGSGATPLSIP